MIMSDAQKSGRHPPTRVKMLMALTAPESKS